MYGDDEKKKIIRKRVCEIMQRQQNVVLSHASVIDEREM
jgi:hypothetical protein